MNEILLKLKIIKFNINVADSEVYCTARIYVSLLI